jgi:hypothetical protein
MGRLAQAEAQKQCVGQVVTKPTWISQWVQTPEVAHLSEFGRSGACLAP